jgi:hypothetical protein
MTIYVEPLVHGTVILSGSAMRLAAIRNELQDDFRCYHYRDNALLMDDELSHLARFAEAHSCRVEQVRNSHRLRVASEDTPEQPKQPKLDVSQNGWYKTNQEAFPLVHVVEIRNEVDPDGIVLWLFDVDLINSGAMPQQATVDADQLKSYSPKPATLQDFEDLDIAPPAGFETEDPHVIPSVEDDVDDLENAPKTAGVSFPQAQMAAQQLQRQLGLQYCRAEAAPSSQGFVVRARVFGRPPVQLPTVVGGTPVEYER